MADLDQSDTPFVTVAGAFGGRRKVAATAIALASVLGLCLILPSVTCTSARRTTEVLEAAGYRDVKPGGYHWVGCGKDRWATEFRATSPDGRRATGAVCCGRSGCKIVRD